MHEEKDEHVPPCLALVKLEADVNNIGGEMRRMRAVVFGVGADESGGLRGDIASLKTWLRALTVFIGALLLLFGPERIAQVVRFLK